MEVLRISRGVEQREERSKPRITAHNTKHNENN